MSEAGDYVTPDDAAKLLKVSVRWVRSMLGAGRFGTRVGKRGYVITRAEVLAFKERPRRRGNPNFYAKQASQSRKKPRTK